MSKKYITSIDELDNRFSLSPGERNRMKAVCEKFLFRASKYYLSLIDCEDRNDPLYLIVIPDARELKGGGSHDPSCGKDYTRLAGLQCLF